MDRPAASAWFGVCLSAGALMVGCGAGGVEPMGGRADAAASQISQIEIRADRERARVGEEVLLTVRTSGPEAEAGQVIWKTTAGELSPLEGGRVCKVTFREPGAHTVTAQWLWRERRVDEDSEVITVR